MHVQIGIFTFGLTCTFPGMEVKNTPNNSKPCKNKSNSHKCNMITKNNIGGRTRVYCWTLRQEHIYPKQRGRWYYSYYICLSFNKEH